MTMLRFPYVKATDEEIDHATAHRLWQGVVARRDLRRRARVQWDLARAFGAGLSVALLLLFAVGVFSPKQTPVDREAAAGPLMLSDGVDWQTLDATESGPRALDFSDGSRVTVDPKGRLTPLENTGRSVVFFLKTGRTVFDVKPGGPRRWSVEAGLATVEVVGTRFTVTRSEDRLIVEVDRGSVLVRGERVTDRVQRLGAGERLTIERDVRSTPPPATSSPVVSPLANAPTSAVAVAPRAVVAPPSWRELAESGAYAAAYRHLGAEGIVEQVRSADLDQLLALADVARLSGHPRDAVEPLQRVIAQHTHDPRAALAAFTLGRVHLDSLGDAAAAAVDFQAAIALHLPRALLEDAHLRLIESRARAGDRQGAHEARENHRRLFPASTRRSIADQWERRP